MRVFAAVLAFVLVVGPVYAQNAGGLGGGGRGGGKGQSDRNPGQQKADPQKQKAAEEAYKAGLKKVPDPKEKFDPWKNAR
jgi:hypothetical protein